MGRICRKGGSMTDGSMTDGSDIILERIANAEEVRDDTPPDPRTPHDGSAGVDQPASGPEGPDRLTREQWKILERCAALDENDTDNAKRLLAWSGDDILHVAETGWYGWLDTHWDQETGEHAVSRAAQALVPRIKREAALIAASDEETEAIRQADRLRAEHPNPRDRSEEIKQLIKHGDDIAKAVNGRRAGRFQFAIKSGDVGRTRAMIAQAEPFRSVLPRELDREDYAINCRNGTLRFAREVDDECPDENVVRFRVVERIDPHDPQDLISKLTNCDYDPEARAPIWEADFARFMPDAATREFLQVFMGYCALGLSGEQVFVFLYGDGGNWKSAFLQSVGRTLGTYCKPMSFGSISGDSLPDGGKPSPDWAQLTSVRLVTVEEVPRKAPLREEQIKVITSGSPMPVRHLNKGLFDLVPKFSAILASNAEPNITGADFGIWRRTLVVRWTVTVRDDERRPFDQVMAMYEPEQAGIFNWVVDGARKYLANGLKPYITDEMRLFLKRLRRDRDAVGAFVGDCVRHKEGTYVTARELYRAFQRWCGANGVDPIISETLFGRNVKRVPVPTGEQDEATGEQTTMGTMEERKRSISAGAVYDMVQLHSVPVPPTEPDGY